MEPKDNDKIRILSKARKILHSKIDTYNCLEIIFFYWR